jgi:hypothetical protein
MASGSVNVFIPDRVIGDYRRRDVFGDVVTSPKVDTKYSPTGCTKHAISLKLAYQMYDDALDRRLNRSPDVDSKLFRDYGRLTDFIKNDCDGRGWDYVAWAPGWRIRTRGWERAERQVIHDLFYRLGIKAAETTE